MDTIFINRTLNLKRIKAIGFDMDYTLVRYNTEEFEKHAYLSTLEKLLEIKHYPEQLRELKFDYNLVIQGLVIDRMRGNTLKLSRFGKVKQAYHGLERMEFSKQQEVYQQKVIDLNDQHIQSLDTHFSISNGVLYQQLVEAKKQGAPLPSFLTIAEDVKEMLDMAHRDGTLKNEVMRNIGRYIIRDPHTVEFLERFKQYDKKLMVITNSDYNYTRLLLDYTINPYLKNHKHWSELFDVVITFACKPRFFTDSSSFLKIDAESGLMSNHDGPVTKGLFQGGNAGQLQSELGLQGDEILYLGDHIYGDVVSLKKTFDWRTALVLEPLGDEIKGLDDGQETQRKLQKSMEEKEQFETQLNELYTKEFELGQKVDKKKVHSLIDNLEKLNQKISQAIVEYQKSFNPYWGELMRAGHEESRFAGQVEKYACIYMAKVSDLLSCSPRTYFRPKKRVLPHEREYVD